MLRLNTFAISHFSEKVRWALDFEGVSYVERRLLPGPHLFVTRRLARGSSVPILEAQRRVIQGSGQILDFLETELGFTRLSPSPAAAVRGAELEALADHAFGLGTQRIFYAELLKDRRALTALWTQGGPSWSRAFYAFGFPTVARAIRRMYETTPEAVARAKQRFREAMAETDRALAGQAYLTGAQPRRVDIAVAALLAPLCRPAQHPIGWSPLPPALRDFASEFEGGATWNHVLKLYREHRARPALLTA